MIEDGVPYGAYVEATVWVQCSGLLADVQCFSHTSFPGIWGQCHQSGCIPVNYVFSAPCMDSNAILHVISLHCILVFCYSLLQDSTSFPNVHRLTVSTRNFVDNTFLSADVQFLTWTSDCCSVKEELKIVLMLSGRQTCSILSLRLRT